MLLLIIWIILFILAIALSGVASIILCFFSTIIAGVLIIYVLTKFYEKDKITIKQLNMIVVSIIALVFIIIIITPLALNNKKEAYIEREQICCIDNGGQYQISDSKHGNGYYCSLLYYITDYDSNNKNRREKYQQYKAYDECSDKAMNEIFGSYDEYKKAFNIK